MNPKNSMFVGVLVMVLVLSMIPVASALSVTQERLDPVIGLVDSETYALYAEGTTLYVAGVLWYENQLTFSSWEGAGTDAELLATYDMEYSYYPMDIMKWDDTFYISVINWSSPDGNDVFSTPLFSWEDGDDELTLVDEFGYGSIGQMAVFGDYLVLMADYNHIIYTDDGDEWVEKAIVNDIEIFDDSGEYDDYYLYDMHNLGMTVVDDALIVETRNCTWRYRYIPSFMQLDGGNQPLAPPPEYNVRIDDTLNFAQLTDLDDDFELEVLSYTLSRVLEWRDSTYWNATTPLLTMPNDEKFVFTVDNAVYTSTTEYKYNRIYNGDTANYNPEPVSSTKLGADNSYLLDSVIVNTVNAVDNAEVCPDPINMPDIGYVMEKPKPIDLQKKVMQGFDASSVIPVGRDAYAVDTTTGKTDFIFTNSVQILWDEVDLPGASVVISSPTGLFTWHTLTIDLTGAIYSVMLVLLIIGIVFLVFGIATWNKGLEDILSLSLGGSLISAALMLYIFPVMYLSWLIVLLPIALFFVFMYYFVSTYKATKLDFHFKSFDTVWIVIIFAVLIGIEIGTGWFTNSFYPGWLPPP